MHHAVFVFSCSAVKFISSISEPVLTPNIFMSWTHLETHQSPDPDLTDTGGLHTERQLLSCALKYREGDENEGIKTGTEVIVRTHCLIGIIMGNWNHYSFSLRTSTLRVTGLEPWWSDNKAPVSPSAPLPSPLFPLLLLTSFSLKGSISPSNPSWFCSLPSWLSDKTEWSWWWVDYTPLFLTKTPINKSIQTCQLQYTLAMTAIHTQQDRQVSKAGYYICWSIIVKAINK